MCYVEPVPSGGNDLTDSSLMSQQKWQYFFFKLVIAHR